MFEKVIEHDVIAFLLEEEGKAEDDGGVARIRIVLHRHPKHFPASQKRVRFSLNQIQVKVRYVNA